MSEYADIAATAGYDAELQSGAECSGGFPHTLGWRRFTGIVMLEITCNRFDRCQRPQISDTALFYQFECLLGGAISMLNRVDTGERGQARACIACCMDRDWAPGCVGAATIFSPSTNTTQSVWIGSLLLPVHTRAGLSRVGDAFVKLQRPAKRNAKTRFAPMVFSIPSAREGAKRDLTLRRKRKGSHAKTPRLSAAEPQPNRSGKHRAWR
jgi:hypothetical protein